MSGFGDTNDASNLGQMTGPFNSQQNLEKLSNSGLSV